MEERRVSDLAEEETTNLLSDLREISIGKQLAVGNQARVGHSLPISFLVPILTEDD